MRQSAKFGLVALGALACLEAVQQVRPRLPGYFLPGVLPNLLAAIAIPFFAISVYVEQRPGQTGPRILRWFTGATVGACVGLIGWEFVQQSGRRLVFDWNDIFATVVGGVVAVGIARRMVGRQAG